jgi:hypothetical protein
MKKKNKYGFETVRDVRLEKLEAEARRDAKSAKAAAKLAAEKAERDSIHSAMTADPHVGVLMKKGKIAYYNSETLEEFGTLDEMYLRGGPITARKSHDIKVGTGGRYVFDVIKLNGKWFWVGTASASSSMEHGPFETEEAAYKDAAP